MRETGGMNKITIITGAGLRLVIDGASGVSAGPDGRAVIQAGGREVNVELPGTAAVTFLVDEGVRQQ